jgi:hypothetical protein
LRKGGGGRTIELMSLLAYSVRRAIGALVVALVVIWLIQLGVYHLSGTSGTWEMGDTAPPVFLERLLQLRHRAHEWDIAAVEVGIALLVLLGLGAAWRLWRRRAT